MKPINKIDLPVGSERRLANGDVVRAVGGGDCGDCYFGRRGRCDLVEYWRATGDWFMCLDYERRDRRRASFQQVGGDSSELVRTTFGWTKFKG